MKRIIKKIYIASVGSLLMLSTAFGQVGSFPEGYGDISIFEEGMNQRLTESQLTILGANLGAEISILEEVLRKIEFEKQLFSKNALLKNTIDQVVLNSQQKPWLKVMRFALNRYRFFMTIMREEMNIIHPEQEHIVLLSSIKLAQLFFEYHRDWRDKFQKQVEVRTPQGPFAVALADIFMELNKNIFDSSAKYRIAYHTMEAFTGHLYAEDQVLYGRVIDTIYRSFLTKYGAEDKMTDRQYDERTAHLTSLYHQVLKDKNLKKLISEYKKKSKK